MPISTMITALYIASYGKGDFLLSWDTIREEKMGQLEPTAVLLLTVGMGCFWVSPGVAF